MAKRLPLTHAMKRLNKRLEGQTGTTIQTARVTNRNPSGGNSATYTVDFRGTASQGFTTTGGDFEPGATVMARTNAGGSGDPQIVGDAPTNKKATQSEQAIDIAILDDVNLL